MNKEQTKTLIEEILSKGWDALVCGEAQSISWLPGDDGSIRSEMASSASKEKKKGENMNINAIVIMEDNEEEVDLDEDDNKDADCDSEGHCIFYHYTLCLSNKLNPRLVELGKMLKQDGIEGKQIQYDLY